MTIWSFQSTCLRILAQRALVASVFATAVGSVPVHQFSACAGETYTEEKEAGLRFDLQGEYLGVIDAWDGNWGAQVIARGPDKLEIHLLKGGLPGEGNETSKPDKILSATIDTTAGSAEGDLDSITYLLKDGKLIVQSGGGSDATSGTKELGVLTRVIRESTTLGATPPEGAIILFDEKTNRFRGAKESKVGLGVGGATEDKFGNHRLHVEFRLPFQPSDEGQARGNSGVYIQGRYELQVLDSFGLEGKNNECGGIYTIAQPKLNMCYPPLSWQTYDIDFQEAKYSEDGKKTKNARVTIKHNGVVIHDDLELKNGTPGFHPEGSGKGPLFLQDHGNPVVFRNIWVVPKPE